MRADPIERLPRDRRQAGGASDGLLTRARLPHVLGDPAGARADLDKAKRIAKPGGMPLYLADIALYRALLFRDPVALAEARRLIDECGYGRRLPALTAAKSW